MSRKNRTIPLNARVTPELRRIIDADRKAKGQSVVEWVERAAIGAIEQSPHRFDDEVLSVYMENPDFTPV